MVESMKNVASMDVELTVEERNLLSVAYKNVIGARRASWRIISSLEQKEENKGGEDKLKMIREYRKTVRRSLNPHLMLSLFFILILLLPHVKWLYFFLLATTSQSDLKKQTLRTELDISTCTVISWRWELSSRKWFHSPKWWGRWQPRNNSKLHFFPNYAPEKLPVTAEFRERPLWD